MNDMDTNVLQGISTAFAIVAFLGVCAWAYSASKKKDFDEAAQLPFNDGFDNDVQSDDKNEADER